MVAQQAFLVRHKGGHVQAAISYTTSPVHNNEFFADLACQLADMGADSICIKDMAGLLVPYKATELISAMKEVTKLPIQLHTHYTSGVASMTYLKAVEAGVDVIDTAMSPFALGTSQPATEVMVETFKGTEFDTGLDQNLLAEIADYFRPYRDECLASGLLNPKVMGVDIKTLLYQVPGGMLSNMVSQLKEQNAEDRYYDVLKEIPEVRKDLGEPPLVTPSSQIVGTQAVFNVIMGERYKTATKEFNISAFGLNIDKNIVGLKEVYHFCVFFRPFFKVGNFVYDSLRPGVILESVCADIHSLPVTMLPEQIRPIPPSGYIHS